MLERIKIQSEIIRLVNKYTPGKRCLTGLSRSSIHDWRIRNGQTIYHEIEDLLLLISEQIGALHDRSNPPKEDVVNDKTQMLVRKLEDQLVEKCSNLSMQN